MKKTSNKLRLKKEVVARMGNTQMSLAIGGSQNAVCNSNTKKGLCNTLPCVDVSLSQIC